MINPHPRFDPGSPDPEADRQQMDQLTSSDNCTEHQTTQRFDTNRACEYRTSP